MHPSEDLDQAESSGEHVGNACDCPFGHKFRHRPKPEPVPPFRTHARRLMGWPGNKTGAGRCTRCDRLREHAYLDYEARTHHGVPLMCFDRRDCERAKRKVQRRRGR